MKYSLARLLFTQPLGGGDVPPERYRSFGRVRALAIGGAIFTDVVIGAILSRDPAMDPRVLRLFLCVNISALAFDVVVSTLSPYWAPARLWRPLLVLGIVIEVGTAMVWVQVSGSVSAYSIALPIIIILLYRIGYDLRLGGLAAGLAVALHSTVVILEIAGVLHPESLFLGAAVGRVYGSPGFMVSSLVSIAGVYAFALFVPNYVMNRLVLKDLELQAVRAEARHGRHSGRLLAERYRLGEVLGRGGMGEVYQGRDERARRDCAVKVLHAHLIGETTSLQRFQREAEVAGRLGSPHIIEVYDAGATAEGIPYIVLELLAGEDLGQRLRRAGPIGVGELLTIARQVAAGLRVAHEAGIVHRDLKPQNLFLAGPQAAPTVKILDFGVCKVHGDAEGLTRTSDILGTPGFMAPEQIAGDARAIDHRTDVFALGAIFYRALCGVLPFGGGDLTRVLYRIAHEYPAPATLVRPDLPADVDAVLAIALAKAPADRYATATALVDDLAAVAAGALSDETRRHAAPLLERARRQQFPQEQTRDALAPTMRAITD
ncbi:MAG: serine/threonine protein kinase [Deltaproteobacteria bacterium]|nr:serine/threonine protein kinase [Deltaproteobacteria bacterium]